jgi:hypothetical protein
VLDALLVYRLPAAATYFFFVTDRLHAATGGFTIQVREWHPDTLTWPATIDLATTPSVVVRGDLDGETTTHQYTLHAPAGYHFAADVVARAASPYSGSAAEVSLTLRNSVGTVLDTSSDRGYGPDPVIYYEPSAAVDLTLEVTRDPMSDPAGGFYLLNLRPAVVINEVYLESATDPTASFVEVTGPAGLPLTGYSVVVPGGYTFLFAATTCSPALECVLGPTGLAVLAHDALVVGGTVTDPTLAVPYAGTVELRFNSVLVDSITYVAPTGALRRGRGHRLDTNNASDLLVQVEESSDEGNYSTVP